MANHIIWVDLADPTKSNPVGCLQILDEDTESGQPANNTVHEKGKALRRWIPSTDTVSWVTRQANQLTITFQGVHPFNTFSGNGTNRVDTASPTGTANNRYKYNVKLVVTTGQYAGTYTEDPQIIIDSGPFIPPNEVVEEIIIIEESRPAKKKKR